MRLAVALKALADVLVSDNARPLLAVRDGFLDKRICARNVVDVAVRIDDGIDGRFAVCRPYSLVRRGFA